MSLNLLYIDFIPIMTIAPKKIDKNRFKTYIPLNSSSVLNFIMLSNYKNNNIVSIEAYDKRKKILTVTKFDGFINIDNIIMPSSISTTEWYNNDESITDSIYIKNISSPYLQLVN